MAKEKTGVKLSALREKILKNSTIDASLLDDSKFYTEKDMIPTDYPMVNVALSGSISGGLTPGITQLAGPSKHFKSMFALLMASAYLKKYPDSMMVFYDSEFGTPRSYFDFFGIDNARVVHKPILNIENLKFDIVKTLDMVDRGEKIIFVIDSIGNLASLKELDDAKAEKSVAEVGARAKALKSLFRMITPYFTLKDIPCIVVNHSYKTLEIYSKDVVSGGTGSYYSSDNIWLIGRQQEKDSEGLKGYNYVIKIEKSRYVREQSKIPILVEFDGGIRKWSGMLDLALEAGLLVKEGRTWRPVNADGEVLSDVKLNHDDLSKDDFWEPLLVPGSVLSNFISKKYSLQQMEKA